MNGFVIGTLVIFALAWWVYISGVRDERFAFTLWFPLTSVCAIGTVLWFWAILGLSSGSGGGEAAGWARFGAAMLFGITLICPILLAVSIWKRPRVEAFTLLRMLPSIVLVGSLALGYRTISGMIENRSLELSVFDTKLAPVSDATVSYETFPRPSEIFSFPAASLSGTTVTGADGSAKLPVPKTQQIEIKVSKQGYAELRVSMDRAWGTYTWHQAGVNWQFPPDNPAKSWQRHSGQVQTDVDDSPAMVLKVFLPRTFQDKIPPYGPFRVFEGQDANGDQKWTKTTPEVHLQ